MSTSTYCRCGHKPIVHFPDSAIGSLDIPCSWCDCEQYLPDGSFAAACADLGDAVDELLTGVRPLWRRWSAWVVAHPVLYRPAERVVGLLVRIDWSPPWTRRPDPPASIQIGPTLLAAIDLHKALVAAKPELPPSITIGEAIDSVRADLVGPCPRCGRLFTTVPAKLRHMELLAKGIRCEVTR